MTLQPSNWIFTEQAKQKEQAQQALELAKKQQRDKSIISTIKHLLSEGIELERAVKRASKEFDVPVFYVEELVAEK